MQLREWRKDAGLRLREVHATLGVTLNRLSELERGLVWPDPKEIAIILDATGGAVTLDDLYQTWHAAHPGVIQKARATVQAMAG